MIIIDLQKELRQLYTVDFKGYRTAQSHILQLGYAIKRMLDDGRLTPFDEFEKNKEKIFDEVEWSKC